MFWLFYFGTALAATHKAPPPGGNVFATSWNDAVGAISGLINWVQHFVGDYGIALMIVTLLIRLVTMPLMVKSLRNTKKMQTLQPRMAKLKETYGKEPKVYQEKMMQLYKEEGVNPFSGCMPMLLQFVVLTILYRAIYTDPAMLHAKFLGMLPLGAPDPTYILPVLAAVTSYFQQKVTMVQSDPSQRMLLFIYPVMILFMGTRVIAALALYWVFSNILTIGQLYFTHIRPKKAGA